MKNPKIEWLIVLGTFAVGFFFMVFLTRLIQLEFKDLGWIDVAWWTTVVTVVTTVGAKWSFILKRIKDASDYTSKSIDIFFSRIFPEGEI